MTDLPTATAWPTPAKQPTDLRDAIRRGLAEHQGVTSESVDDQLNAVLYTLRAGGWIRDGAPPVVQVLADAQRFSDELVLAKLVARFFRVLILSGLTLRETPAAMDWLRDYIDGNIVPHGPLGQPMVWPDRLVGVTQLLRDWGFQPTPTQPPFVSLRPGGVMAPVNLPDPEAPDPRSVRPLDPTVEALMASILDRTCGAPGAMAVDRGTALRALAAAHEAGRLGLATPPEQSYPATSLETAACAWEAVLAMENVGREADDQRLDEEQERGAAIRATRWAMGSSHLRLTVLGWVDRIDAAWRDVDTNGGQEPRGGVYGLSFDWDFVPGWIAANVDWSNPCAPTVREQAK